MPALPPNPHPVARSAQRPPAPCEQTGKAAAAAMVLNAYTTLRETLQNYFNYRADLVTQAQSYVLS